LADALEHNSTNELLGKNITELLFTQENIFNNFINQLNHYGFINNFETTIIIPSGFKRILAITAHYIKDSQEGVIGIQGFVQDITEKKQLETNLANEREKLTNIIEYTRCISEIVDQKKLAREIIFHTSRILEATRCSLMLIDQTTHELYMAHAVGINPDDIPKIRVKPGEGIDGIIINDKSSLLISNIEFDQQFHQANKKAYTNPSCIISPIIYHQQIFGLINVANGKQPFSTIDLHILDAIAKQAAITFNMAISYAYLNENAKKDPVTGLLNYRAFLEHLNNEMARLERYHAPLSLMMIDIDYFKKINDTYGHEQANHILKIIAHELLTHTRNTDIICRYAGDEFCIILPNTSLDDAKGVGEKINKMIAHRLKEFSLTLSIGIAQAKAHDTSHQFIDIADQALYRAKSQGRNTVSI
jgi:diguanylate cyclase (GGDEF)-like protein